MIFTKSLPEEEEEEEERRTKQSLDSPQTIEANKKIYREIKLLKVPSGGNSLRGVALVTPDQPVAGSGLSDHFSD